MYYIFSITPKIDINKSLSFLEQVIIALSDKKRDHVPYRQSKLTTVLRDALGGNCNTLLIANIWGEEEHIEETISTLRFATRMMCVSTNPQMNVQYDPLALLKKYEREIRELKMELSMHDTLSNKSHVQYEPFSETQRLELMKSIRGFVDGEADEIEVINLRQIRELFSGFRNMIKHAEQESEGRVLQSASQGTLLDQPSPSISHDSKNFGSTDMDGVGEMEGGGFGVGMVNEYCLMLQAPKNKQKRPGVKKSSGKGVQQGSQLAQALSGAHANMTDEEVENERDPVEEPTFLVSDNIIGGLAGGKSPQPHAQATRSKGPPSRTQEYENFKHGRGSEMSKIFTENKAVLREKRHIAREAAIQLNKLKEQIDAAKTRLDLKIRERTSGETYDPKDSESVVIDEEEYALFNTMKPLKTAYRVQYTSLSEIRSEIEYCARLVDQCRQRLMTEFEAWYVNSYGMSEVAGKVGEDDVIDIGEKFDRLQSERMSHEDPDSVPYYNARREISRKLGVKRGQKAIK
jgi:kinesin family protein 6/9